MIQILELDKNKIGIGDSETKGDFVTVSKLNPLLKILKLKAVRMTLK